MLQECPVKSKTGEGRGYGTRMSVKSNDGGGGAQFSEASSYVTNVIVVLCFLVLYGGSGSYGRDRSVCDTIHAG